MDYKGIYIFKKSELVSKVNNTWIFLVSETISKVFMSRCNN